ncbi:anti-sigma regulatory factor [Methanosarcina sp. KYL-1]|uniref:anti-sigma regulatory factor n=1 Tax=Methanosarcina sp. KYL-1 TaxID=2602068 RepID=UPI002101CB76
MSKRIPLQTESDLLFARQAAREMMREMGFGSADQTRMATAISELARNVLKYAGEGTCTLIDEQDEREMVLRVVVEDNGPGITNIDQAMEDGFTTGNGLGAGLPGAKRLVNNFDIASEPGYTKITMEIRRHANK